MSELMNKVRPYLKKINNNFIEYENEGIDCNGRKWIKIPLGKARDITGKKVGKVTPLFRVVTSLNEKRRRTYWLCLCDCGNLIIAMKDNLDNGHCISCGCISKEKMKAPKNLTDIRFEKLLPKEEIIMPDRTGRKRTYWLCLCDCGNFTLVRRDSLINGNTKSCGCLFLETVSKNLLGVRCGLLVPFEKTDKRAGSNIIWKCKCDCGEIVERSEGILRKKGLHSCGCINSNGEKIIKLLLKENNIFFESEKSFSDCIFPETQGKLRFDFYINNSFLLEFDGRQHFEKKSTFGEGYENIHKRDLFKNQWCNNKKIPLKRIPYTDIDKITLENILDNTYLLKEDYYNNLTY